MKNRIGPPVEGEDFVGREKEINHVWKKIEEGNHFILAAPRRVGKSSFGKKILKIANDNTWKVLELNLEGISSEKQFLKEFIYQIKEESWWASVKSNANETLMAIVDSVNSIETGVGKIEFDWSKTENLYKDLKKLLESLDNCLIMMDELTIYLNRLEVESGTKRTEYFLNWLRSFRQKSNTQIRWIFCSSVSIENYTNLNNMSYTLNDVHSLSIGAFDKSTALLLLEKLEENKTFAISDNHKNYVLKKIGWLLPYFIQLYFSKIEYEIIHNRKKITKQTLDDIYTDLLENKTLDTWVERLVDYKANAGWAKKILKINCKTAEGLTKARLIDSLTQQIPDIEEREEVVIKVLNMLLNDGYLIKEKDKYPFRSPFLRDYWFNKFVI